MRSIGRFTVVLVAVFFAVVPAAVAGGPGSWTPVSGSDLPNLTEVSLARTPDGVLHVLWTGTASRTQVFHRGIGADGTLGSTTSPLTSSEGLENPAILWDGSQLRAFMPGILPLSPNNSYTGLLSSTAPMDGGSWSNAISLTPSGSSYAGPVRAILPEQGGRPFET